MNMKWINFFQSVRNLQENIILIILVLFEEPNFLDVNEIDHCSNNYDIKLTLCKFTSEEFNKNSDANIKLCLNSLQQSLGTNFASENPNIKESRLEFVETSKLLLEKIEESKLLLKKDETAHKSLFLGKINDYKKTLKKHYRDFSTKFFNDINIFHKDFDYFSKAEKAK